MERTRERRLVFVVSEKWSGWYCERCRWNRRLPAEEEEKRRLAAAVESQFRLHQCAQFPQEERQAGD